jgi:hypothetical protein
VAGVSHHVAVALPGGGRAVADYRQPIVLVMRKVNGLIAEHSADKLIRGTAPVAAVAAYRTGLAVVAAWLEHHPDQACQAWPDETACTHGPAIAGPATLPRRYVPDWP